MKKIVTALTLAAFLMTGTGFVYAADADITCSQISDAEVRITGNGVEGSSYFVEVFSPDTDVDNFTFGEDHQDNAKALVYICQGNIGQGGSFTETFKLSGKIGLYKVRGSVSDITFEEEEFVFVDTEKYLRAVQELNLVARDGSKSLSDFVKVLDDNKDNINFSQGKLNASKNEINKIFRNECKRKPLDEASDDAFAVNNSRYLAVSLIAALNEKTVGNIFSYKNVLENAIDYSKIEEFMQDGKFLSDSEVQSLITKRLSGYNINNLDEFSDCFFEAVTLAAIEKPNGVKGVKEIIQKYSDVTGISLSGITDSQLNTLLAKKYNSVAEFKTALSNIKNGTKKQPNGSSSGGGSGNGSYNPPLASKSENEEKKTIPNDVYIDLDDVIWARDAIVTLSGIGVLSGVGDNRFAPNDLVTREQFVKMLVAAFVKSDKLSEISFADVDESMWYTPYIKSAVANEIVNGVSENIFGVGQNITRQDMATMVYRAVLRTYKSDKTEVDFADFESVSDYAKDAVVTMADKGIINGKGDGLFCPFDNATRAEAAKIIYETIKLIY